MREDERRGLPWPGHAKVMEFEPSDPRLMAALGPYGKYVAVRRRNEAQHFVKSRPPLLAEHSVPVDSLPVSSNNADVLVFNGPSVLLLRRYRPMMHVQHIVVRCDSWWWTLTGLVLGLPHVLVKRLHFRGLQRLAAGDASCRLLVFENRRPRRRHGARRYIPHCLGMAGFLRKLQEEKVRHVVLRWFDTLPDLPAGEDLDLLVADEDVPKVESILASGPGWQPCDLYSAGGLPGTDYQGLPYFPPDTAGRILERAVPHRCGAMVPVLEDYFFSLAYHALYHKGGTGLVGKEDSHQPGGHNYRAVLRDLAATLGWQLPDSLTDWHRFLEQHAWAPSYDLLVRLAHRRPALSSLIRSGPADPADRGLAVFVLRQEAVVAGAVERLVAQIEREGFQIVAVERLPPGKAREVARSMRGGNWGAGPWPVSGGLPAVVVVAFDPEPIPLSRKERARFPHVTNARLLCKHRLRDQFNRHRAEQRRCNVIHSSDSEDEAIEYLKAVMPERIPEIRSQIQRIRRQWPAREPVLCHLRQGRRSRVQLVEFDGQLAVKKVFKPSQQRFKNREALALRHLSRMVPAVPPLLAEFPNAVVMPYYRDTLRFDFSSGKLLPLQVAREAILALRAIYEQGFAVIDAHPGNLIVDPVHGTRLVDFEFLYRYEKKPPCFEEAYDMAGCPEDFDGDVPMDGVKTYERFWQPYVGLSLQSLLYDPPWLQHLKRTLYVAARLHVLMPRRLRGYARALIRRVARRQDAEATPALQQGRPPYQRRKAA